MAMTKKEQQMVADLQHEVRLAKALRLTQRVEPDVPVPTSFSTDCLSFGYIPIGAQSDYPRVEVACSSSGYHAVGRTDRTTSQGARRLFSTRLLALRALRYEVEQKVAQKLAKIDKMIEDEEAKEIKEG